MSRYHEIRDAWISSRDHQLANRDACFRFVEHFREGLVDFLGIPPEFVRLSPTGETGCDESLTVAGASALDDGGFWRTGLSIAIAKDLPGSPSLDARVVLHVKRRGDDFLLKLYEGGDSIVIPGSVSADWAPAYDFVFRELMRWIGPSDA